jgi:hypothetical protein
LIQLIQVSQLQVIPPIVICCQDFSRILFITLSE